MIGSRIFLALWLGVAGMAMAQDGPRPPDERGLSAFSADPHRQFDFWIGEWDVNLRIRQPDLSWKDSVAARARIYSILKGKAILELWDSEPIKGMSLRYYDPSKEKWVLWLDWPKRNVSRLASLEGAFRHGRGEFFSEFDTPEGKHVIARYAFDDITPGTLRWDDAYSADGGKTWSQNWIMEWTRRRPEPDWPLPDPAPTYVDGGRCDAAPFRAHEALAGDRIARAPARDEDAWLHMRKVLDGCAVLGVLRVGEREWFLMTTWASREEVWSLSMLSDTRGEPLQRYTAKDDPMTFRSEAGATVTFRVAPGGGLTLDMRGPDGAAVRTLRLRPE